MKETPFLILCPCGIHRRGKLAYKIEASSKGPRVVDEMQALDMFFRGGISSNGSARFVGKPVSNPLKNGRWQKQTKEKENLRWSDGE